MTGDEDMLRRVRDAISAVGVIPSDLQYIEFDTPTGTYGGYAYDVGRLPGELSGDLPEGWGVRPVADVDDDDMLAVGSGLLVNHRMDVLGGPELMQAIDDGVLSVVGPDDWGFTDSRNLELDAEEPQPWASDGIIVDLPTQVQGEGPAR